MDKPLVSAIVPVYNGERYLAAALDSIVAQDYQPLEIIVVDDGSVDGTRAIAQGYAAVHYIYQADQGLGMTLHVGAAAAKGEFLAFLDADDLWATNKLNRQVNCLLQQP